MGKLAVVGLGLIGGSMALDLKKRLKYQVYGIDKNHEHIKSALKLGIIDKESDFSDLKKIVTSFKYESRTIILFESPKRIQKSLKIMLDILGETRKVSIARELTKIHETILRMSLKEANLVAKTDPNLSKGEIVIILEGVDKKFSDFDIKLDELFKYLGEDISLKNFSKVFLNFSFPDHSKSCK